MEKKAAKDMIPIYIVQMQTKPKHKKGFSFVEMVMVMLIVSLITLMTIVGYTNFAPKLKFSSKAKDIVDLFEMATIAADQSDRRYAILIDFTNYDYTLYEITSSEPYNLETYRDEDIINSGQFTDYCQLIYVQFDDSPKTIDGGEEGMAIFAVGNAGWDYGGKVVISDLEGNYYSVVVGRMNKRVKLVKGDAVLMQPEINLAF